MNYSELVGYNPRYEEKFLVGTERTLGSNDNRESSLLVSDRRSQSYFESIDKNLSELKDILAKSFKNSSNPESTGGFKKTRVKRRGSKKTMRKPKRGKKGSKKGKTMRRRRK